MSIFEQLFRSKEQPRKSEAQDLKVGDWVMHPFRDEPTQVLAVGTEIWRFIPEGYLKNIKSGEWPVHLGHEAIKDSPMYHRFEQMGFTKKKVHSVFPWKLICPNRVPERYWWYLLKNYAA